MFDFIRRGDIDAFKAKIKNLDNENKLWEALQARDSNGRTLLHVAALEGHFEIVSELLRQDVNMKANDKDGLTPLALAEKAGHNRVAAFLRTRMKWQGDAFFNVSRVTSLLMDAVPKITRVFAGNAERYSEGAVLIMGDTGSGKSTLLNYLLGAEYELCPPQMIGQPPTVRLKSGVEYASRGTGMQSETLYPNVFPPMTGTDDNFIYCDLPGFGENRGIEAAICAASSVQLLTRLPPRLVKSVLVVLDFNGFGVSKGAIFKNTIKTLNQILGHDRSLSYRPIYFVITKAEGVEKDTLINSYIDRILDGAGGLNDQAARGRISDDNNELRETLEWMRNNPNCIFIPDVFDRGDSRDELRDAINESMPESVNLFDFMNHDDSLLDFNTMVLSIARAFSESFKELKFNIPRAIELEKDKENSEKRDIEQWTSKINDMVAQINKPFDRSTHEIEINEKKKNIKQNEERKKEKDKLLVDISQEREMFAKKISEIDTDKPILIWEKPFNHSAERVIRERQEAILKPRRKHHHNKKCCKRPPKIVGYRKVQDIIPATGEGKHNFIWSCPYPILRCEHNKSAGRFEQNINVDKKQFSATFTYPRGVDARVQVKIFVEQRYKMSEEIKKLQGSIEECDRKLKEVGDESNKLVDHNKRLNEEILERNELIRSSEITTARLQGLFEAEIEKRKGWIQTAKSRLSEAVNCQKRYEKMLEDIKLELEVNKDLFEVIYEITEKLEMTGEIIKDFRKNFDLSSGRRTNLSENTSNISGSGNLAKPPMLFKKPERPAPSCPSNTVPVSDVDQAGPSRQLPTKISDSGNLAKPPILSKKPEKLAPPRPSNIGPVSGADQTGPSKQLPTNTSNLGTFRHQQAPSSFGLSQYSSVNIIINNSTNIRYINDYSTNIRNKSTNINSNNSTNSNNNNRHSTATTYGSQSNASIGNNNTNSTGETHTSNTTPSPH